MTAQDITFVIASIFTGTVIIGGVTAAAIIIKFLFTAPMGRRDDK